MQIPFLTTLKVLGGTSGAALLGFYCFLNKILYQPKPIGMPSTPKENPYGYRSPQDRGLKFLDVYLQTSDKIVIHSWLVLSGSNANQVPTILLFQGNAGNMGFRMDSISYFNELGYNVFIISYRGYGESTGTPNQKGIERDADAALKYLLEECDQIDRNQIVIFGESIGGAVAINLLSRNQDKRQIKGLIIVNTFTSIFNISSNRDLKFFRGNQKDITTYFNDLRTKRSSNSSLYDVAIKKGFNFQINLVQIPEGDHNETWEIFKYSHIKILQDFIKNSCKQQVLLASL